MLNRRLLIVASGGVLAIGWIAPASSHVAADPSRPVVTHTVCSGVELHLQPGVIGGRHYPNDPSARNLPLDPVVLAVPLYPDAKPSNLLANSPPGSGLPWTPYIKTGAAEYSVAATTESVESWYQSNFARCGYLSNGYGYINNGSRTDFRDFQNPSLQQGQVTMSYDPTGGGSTIVRYYGWAITLPRRPARSFIPAGRIGSMRVTYYPPELLRRPLRKIKPVRVVITNQTLIQDVASAVDALPMSERGLLHECGLMLAPPDFVRLELRGGRSMGITVDDCGLVVMRTASLSDVNGAAGSALGFVVYKWLYSHPHVRIVRAQARSAGPAVYVEPHPAYSASPLTFVVKHAGPNRRWQLVVSAYPPAAGDINLGVHRANRWGVIRVHHRPFGDKFAHFNRKTGAEKWIVNAIQPHPIGNEPGPYNKIFVVHRGCGCH